MEPIHIRQAVLYTRRQGCGMPASISRKLGMEEAVPGI